MTSRGDCNARGIEYAYVDRQANHDKYWQILWADHEDGALLATRYGRRGSLGAVTVKHFRYLDTAEGTVDRACREKSNKGYRICTPEHAFHIPEAIATRAASTGSTGYGGTNPHAAFALYAYYIASLAETGTRILRSGDAMQDEILRNRITPHHLAVAALAGYSYTNPAWRALDEDALTIMAGLLLPSGETIGL